MEQEPSLLSSISKFFEYIKIYINESIETIKQNIPLFIVVLISIFILYQSHLASNDPYASTKNLMTYLFTIIIPIIAIFLYMVFVSFDGPVISYIIGGTGIFVIVFAIGFWLLNSFITKYIFNVYVLYAIYVLMALVLLSIAYNVLKKYLVKMNGWMGLLANLLFYIPCLVTDAIQYIMGDFYSTPRSTLILVGVEVALLMLYFYIIPFLKTKINTGAFPLLKEPKFLDKYVEIDREMKKEKPHMFEKPYYKPNTIYDEMNEDHQSKLEIRKTYALSMWIYLNPMPPNKEGYDKETTIFKYSSNLANGHPKITYKNVNGEDQFFLYFSGTGKPYKVKMPKQKWNNVVFNYKSDSVDVFINGKIERTYTFSKKNIPKYSTKDVISIGPENGEEGLYGSISNIVYYPYYLSKHQITSQYNLNFMKNPPYYE